MSREGTPMPEVSLPQHLHPGPNCEVCAQHLAEHRPHLAQRVMLVRHLHTGPDCEVCAQQLAPVPAARPAPPSAPPPMVGWADLTRSIANDTIRWAVLGSMAGAAYGAISAIAFALLLLFLTVLFVGGGQVESYALVAAFGMIALVPVGWAIGLVVGGIVGGLHSDP